MKIVSLELPPGSTINESELQEELGLSRTPIREALQRLALEKLVHIVPRRGIFVTDIHITDLHRLFEIRLNLEPLAVRLACRRAGKDTWKRLQAQLNSLPPPGEASNEDLIQLDERFHSSLYAATDNEFLEDILRTLYTLSLRLWYYFLEEIGDVNHAVREHETLLAALIAGDEDRAALCMSQHVEAFQREIQTAMLGSEMVFERNR